MTERGGGARGSAPVQAFGDAPLYVWASHSSRPHKFSRWPWTGEQCLFLDFFVGGEFLRRIS